MSARRSAPPRGRPLVMLTLVLAGWILVRAVLWDLPFAQSALLAEASAGTGHVAAGLTALELAQGAVRSTPPQSIARPDLAPLPARIGAPPPAQLPIAIAQEEGMPGRVQPTALVQPGLAASHQLMWLAAAGHLPVPQAMAQAVASSAGPDPARPAASAREERWSLDSWALWRPDSGGALVSQGRVPTYGASQAGAVLAYRLAPADRRDPRAYMRAYRALIEGGESELAFGANARLVPGLPLRAHAELRVTRFASGTAARPAAFVTSELPPLDLPGRLRGEAYFQGGYVGGKEATPFFDGQGHLLHPVADFDLARISAGAAAWGGVQQGARRLDLGPSMRVDLELAKTPARLAIDWRERVAGNAAPQSSVAVTLSTRF